MKCVHSSAFMQSIDLFQDPDLICDLCVDNNSQPEKYKHFLEECQKYINGVLEMAADDRRHDQTIEESLNVFLLLSNVV